MLINNNNSIAKQLIKRLARLTNRQNSVMFATLFLFWIMLQGSLSFDVVFMGILVSIVIVWLYPSGLSFFTEFKTTPQAFRAGFRYYGYFFKELIFSNFRLAAVVLSPSLPINPGIVKVRTKLKSKMGRLMLANSITLTPGTLTVDLEGEWLYVHWVLMESEDIEIATQKIVSGFESYLEVMYG